MKKLELYYNKIKEWEYCYCNNCKSIRYGSDLKVTNNGIKCSKCGTYDLEAPEWVHCPHEKTGAVKCPRAGKGITRKKFRYFCKYHCDFRII